MTVLPQFVRQQISDTKRCLSNQILGGYKPARMSALWLGGRPITLGQAMYRSGPPNLVSLSNQHQLATRPVCTYPVQVEFCTPSCAIRGQMDRHRLPSCGDRHPGAPDQVVPSAPAHRHLQLQGRPALSNCNYNAVPNVSHGVQYVAHPQSFVSHFTTCTCTSTASHSAKCPTPQSRLRLGTLPPPTPARSVRTSSPFCRYRHNAAETFLL